MHHHPTYFAVLFRRITGYSPHQYLARYRLDRARELLHSTDRPISAIARATGFGDGAYLSRVIKRAEGVPPRAYRRLRRGQMNL